VQLPEIAVIEKPADHVRRDHLCTERVELVSGRELKTAIGASKRSLETSMEKARAGLNDDHSGSAAVEMAIGQPEEWFGLGLRGHAASIGRGASTFNPLAEPRPRPKLLGVKSRDRMGEIAAAPHTRESTRPRAAALLIGVIAAPLRTGAIPRF
jgi:hypothetical protein